MSYTLDFDIKPLNEEEYAAAPEAVRRVYIAVLQSIPVPTKEIKSTIKAHPEYFTLKKKEVKKTFGQNVKRLFALKGAKESFDKKSKITAEAQRTERSNKGFDSAQPDTTNNS